MNGSPPIIAVVGPTATGKTGLGVQLAKALGREVISADSRIIYKELDIGTAKPSMAEMQGVPHHLINCIAPTEVYSVARYQEEATEIINTLVSNENPPVVVGGTGFYIKALLQETFIPAVPPDEALRQQLVQQEESQGAGTLYQLLSEKDPRRAQAIHPNDQCRILRALEIIHHTGQPVPQQAQLRDLNVFWVGLTYADRSILDRQIDSRIEAMIAQGWIEEVQTLLQRYGSQAEALQITHGYPEWVQYLQGTLSYSEAVAQIQIQIHQYSRRQMTWFRRNPAITWYCVDQQSQAAILEDILAKMVLGACSKS